MRQAGGGVGEAHRSEEQVASVRVGGVLLRGRVRSPEGESESKWGCKGRGAKRRGQAEARAGSGGGRKRRGQKGESSDTSSVSSVSEASAGSKGSRSDERLSGSLGSPPSRARHVAAELLGELDDMDDAYPETRFRIWGREGGLSSSHASESDHSGSPSEAWLTRFSKLSRIDSTHRRCRAVASSRLVDERRLSSAWLSGEVRPELCEDEQVARRSKERRKAGSMPR
mmetsp:Transcript_9826/g.31029  ORF Transcript_9826/g.31029 Transcript_9826/m.31029 type:complete len:227 (-) Transcript_9826:51-731(-)